VTPHCFVSNLYSKYALIQHTLADWVHPATPQAIFYFLQDIQAPDSFEDLLLEVVITAIRLYNFHEPTLLPQFLTQAFVQSAEASEPIKQTLSGDKSFKFDIIHKLPSHLRLCLSF